MRYIMRGCDKIYIVCAFILKFKKYFRQPVRCYFKAFMLRRYFSVLTIHTPKITPRKEHRSRTALTGNTRLFPHMQCGTCHIKLITLTAYTDCPASVNTAVSRTKCADHRSMNSSNRGRMPMPSGKCAANCGIAWLGKELPSMNTGPSGVIATSHATKRTCGTTRIAFRHIALTSSQ